MQQEILQNHFKQLDFAEKLISNDEILNAEVIYSIPGAPWAVFIHGLGGSANTWQYQLSDYKARYNLLFLNLHDSSVLLSEKRLNVARICSLIAQTMELYQIEKAHLVSLSSGSMIALAFAALYPQKLTAVVLGGGIITFNMRTNFLLLMARMLQNIVPYMVLYRFFARIMMPRVNHKKSREIFVREATKLGHTEFCRWVNFLPQLVNNWDNIARLNKLAPELPLLYIMGGEDHLFISSTQRNVTRLNNASIKIIPHCGHVCTIEKAQEFNKLSLRFFAKIDKLYPVNIKKISKNNCIM